MSTKNTIQDILGDFAPTRLRESARAMIRDAVRESKTSILKSQRIKERFDDFDNDESTADELVLYATNDSRWYHRWAIPIIKNLKKHVARGRYDTSSALKSWARAADAAAEMYAREFGDSYDGMNGKQMFSPRVRRLAAMEFEEYFEDEVYEDED